MNWGGACCCSKNGCIANDQNGISTKILLKLEADIHETELTRLWRAGMDSKFDGGIWRDVFQRNFERNASSMDFIDFKHSSIGVRRKTQTSGMRVSSDFILKDLTFTFTTVSDLDGFILIEFLLWNWIVSPSNRGPQHLMNNVNKHQPLSPYRVQMTNLNILVVDGKRISWSWDDWTPRKEHEILHIQEVLYKNRIKLPHVPCTIYLYVTTHVAMFKPILVKRTIHAVSGICSVYIYTRVVNVYWYEHTRTLHLLNVHILII